MRILLFTPFNHLLSFSTLRSVSSLDSNFANTQLQIYFNLLHIQQMYAWLKYILNILVSTTFHIFCLRRTEFVYSFTAQLKTISWICKVYSKRSKFRSNCNLNKCFKMCLAWWQHWHSQTQIIITFYICWYFLNVVVT